ncbi:uncharacterized protein BDCG_01732 [Blastomyces dermatitidis ER-3]|uniref:Uncharacterized protein n=1 Tax=Ajellomyces dermatitidis (strain ER-3 / ATCC MYA-2586) TaxID=559297 RepID=A0ABP2ES94_AJEDR|nr:uncharacterized protein BDCG_01732 [Blastomyces dermatitidis ER-3]EEQ86612.1 hypothetical protein BDCG_01732 [Blastomyces dermatitidis ER-3]
MLLEFYSLLGRYAAWGALYNSYSKTESVGAASKLRNEHARMNWIFPKRGEVVGAGEVLATTVSRTPLMYHWQPGTGETGETGAGAGGGRRIFSYSFWHWAIRIFGARSPSPRVRWGLLANVPRCSECKQVQAEENNSTGEKRYEEITTIQCGEFCCWLCGGWGGGGSPGWRGGSGPD